MGSSYGRAKGIWLAEEMETVLLGIQHTSWKGVYPPNAKADMHPRSQGSDVLPLNQKLLLLLEMTMLRDTSSWTRTSRPSFASAAAFEYIALSI